MVGAHAGGRDVSVSYHCDGYLTRSHLRGEGKAPPHLAGLKGCSLPWQGRHGSGSMMGEACADLLMS